MSARRAGRPLTARASACSSGATRAPASDAAPLPAVAVAALTKLPIQAFENRLPFSTAKKCLESSPRFFIRRRKNFG